MPQGCMGAANTLLKILDNAPAKVWGAGLGLLVIIGYVLVIRRALRTNDESAAKSL